MDMRYLVLAFIAVAAVGLITPMVLAGPPERGVKICNDGYDNDGDGYTDWPDDPGCQNKNDQSELNPNIECDDGYDNDGDDDIDYNDAGCSGPTDDDETDCGDGVCEGGEVCDVCVADCGTCSNDSCSDTDGGNVITVFGTTSGYLSGEPYSNDDYCADSSNIMEYYCSGDYEQSQQQSCGTDVYVGDRYCLNGSAYKDWRDYSCASGECGHTDTPTLQQTCLYGCTNGTCDDPPPNTCNDTDGGIVEDVFGTVYGYLYGEYEYDDFCNNTAILSEFYCYEGTYPVTTEIDCTINYTSCSSGVCV